MLTNKTIYFPALSAGIIDKNDLKHKSGKTFKFYLENSLFSYYNFLISAGTHCKKNLKQDINFTFDKGIVLGDSGGYQLVSGVLKYKDTIVDEILNWLEENTNYALNIDYPVRDEKDKFFERLEISYKNYLYFAKNRKNKTKLLNVLHGPELKDLNIWYDRIKEFDFEGGWAIGSTIGNIYRILVSFFFLYGKGELSKTKSHSYLCHILGFSKIKEMPIIMYLQNKLNRLNNNTIISFDSSSPFYIATFGRSYFSSSKNGFGVADFSSKLLKDSNLNFDTNLPCQCPVCKDITFKTLMECFDEDSEEKRSIFYLYLGTHNFYKMIDFKSSLENLVQFNSQYANEFYFDSSTINLFKIIDKAFECSNPAEYIESEKFRIVKYASDLSKLDSNLEKDQKQTLF